MAIFAAIALDGLASGGLDRLSGSVAALSAMVFAFLVLALILRERAD